MPNASDHSFAHRLYLCLNAVCGQLSEREFQAWFSLLSPIQQRQILDVWYAYIQANGYEVWLSDQSPAAQINVKYASGADSGLARVF
ncbi:MAG: hypothetical protein HY372_02905 [Candidatus Andersenbacteria bacterium]|nr:hypothetical protein [Candidatus Andersenbacteria bacterium]